MTFLLLYWRQIAAVAGVGLLLGGAAWWSHARYEAGVRDERARAERERRSDEKRTDAITKESGHAFAVNLDSLNSRVTQLLAVPDVPAIRLCSPAPAVQVPAAAGQSDAAAGGQQPAVRMGSDIGDDALVLAGRCERDRQQLIALQGWIRGSVRTERCSPPSSLDTAHG